MVVLGTGIREDVDEGAGVGHLHGSFDGPQAHLWAVPASLQDRAGQQLLPTSSTWGLSWEVGGGHPLQWLLSHLSRGQAWPEPLPSLRHTCIIFFHSFTHSFLHSLTHAQGTWSLPPMESGWEADFTLINMTQLFNYHGDECYKLGEKDGATEASNRYAKEGMSEPRFGHQRGRGVSREGEGRGGQRRTFKAALSSLLFNLPWCMLACSVTQSCPTLCNSMDCNPPGFSVHGISQARILEWIAISFSKGSS